MLKFIHYVNAVASCTFDIIGIPVTPQFLKWVC